MIFSKRPSKVHKTEVLLQHLDGSLESGYVKDGATFSDVDRLYLTNDGVDLLSTLELYYDPVIIDKYALELENDAYLYLQRPINEIISGYWLYGYIEKTYRRRN